MAELRFFAVLQLSFTLTFLVHAQNQKDFISIDCGLEDTPSYTDDKTSIMYQSDDSFIDTGLSHNISSEYKTVSLEKQFWNVRSFPEGNRNCYSFYTSFSSNTVGIKYLIRARFMYGNYDGENFVPNFDIYLGTRWWDSVEFENASTVVTKEVIYNVQSDHIHVCLCNTNKGTPFISVLELRALHHSPYRETYDLQHFARLNIGSQDGQIVRYPIDAYDRMWTPYNSIDWKTISTPHTVDVRSDDEFLPSRIMRTAATPANGGDSIYLRPKYKASTYMVYLHFAEVEEPKPAGQFREFDVFINGVQLDATQPEYLVSKVLQQENQTNADETLEIWIKRTNSASFPPILNAIEIYTIKDFFYQLETDPIVYNAIMNIKSYYRIKRNWHGDPCIPKTYTWEGVNCSTIDGFNIPKITFLNLSSSGLTGNITEEIAKLKWIETLDLSHNNLTGEVPAFLSQLNLKFLNLEGNNLSGTIPSDLLELSEKGLHFRCEGNPNLMCPGSGNKRRQHNKVVIPLLASLGGAFLFAAITFWIFKRRQPDKDTTSFMMPSFELPLNMGMNLNKQQFTYEEVISITNNFRRILGKGGFGTVYHGYIGTTQVAVKMLSPSVQGYLQFQAEAELLTIVHHKRLTSLIGYCDEGTNVALIYEYMANGDLSEHLSAKSGKLLGWKQRLQIAVDAAEGLEYLHNGCKPPIVHRDIKPQNILLNENMRGKLADFGLSRIFSDEADTHVSTVIAGTFGYLDPEYFMSNKLNEKSDVYSFGIVLLEIITGQPAIAKTEERAHIIQRLDSMPSGGEIQDIVDPRLKGEFDTDSARKFLDMAMACVAPTSMERPTMSQVVVELKQCLGMVMTQTSYVHGTTLNCLIDVSFDMISGESSLAR